MSVKRCIAFKQSPDIEQLLVPCTNQVAPLRVSAGGSGREGAFFCRHHAQAYRELMIGILHETRQHRSKTEAPAHA